MISGGPAEVKLDPARSGRLIAPSGDLGLGIFTGLGRFLGCQHMAPAVRQHSEKRIGAEYRREAFAGSCAIRRDLCSNLRRHFLIRVLACLRCRRRRTRAAGLSATVAKLESLSPLAVLGRGYAVCWNADRTAIVRDAAHVQTGDRVRVTLAHGELACEVRDR